MVVHVSAVVAFDVVIGAVGGHGVDVSCWWLWITVGVVCWIGLDGLDRLDRLDSPTCGWL